jgi:uncharacterized membrane protein
MEPSLDFVLFIFYQHLCTLNAYIFQKAKDFYRSKQHSSETLLTSNKNQNNSFKYKSNKSSSFHPTNNHLKGNQARKDTHLKAEVANHQKRAISCKKMDKNTIKV